MEHAFAFDRLYDNRGTFLPRSLRIDEDQEKIGFIIRIEP